MSKISKAQKIINKIASGIKIDVKDNIVFLSGEVDSYNLKLKCGMTLAKKKLFEHVVNEISVKGEIKEVIKEPSIQDKSLDNLKVDVLIIGAGVIGCSIARYLSQYDCSTLLIDKEEDVGLHASSRNDGNVHVGLDLKKKSSKLKYLCQSRLIFQKLCQELDVDYQEIGQGIVVTNRLLTLPLRIYLRHKARTNKVAGVRYYNRKELLKYDPNLSKEVCGGEIFATAGEISPYEFTIALAENAVENGVKISLNTMVKDMIVKDDEIQSVITNRGIIYPKIVINAAGVFTEDIAKMAHDHFFSIHPRKGTDVIFDKKAKKNLSRSSITVYNYKKSSMKVTKSKGGGVIPTVDGNILVGPDAIEVMEKEDFSVSMDSINNVINKQLSVYNKLNFKDVITYFAGIRAASYEEDFIVCKGKWIKNIIHAAGIQSPGLTCAPGIGIDVCSQAISVLGNCTIKKNWNPLRKGIVKLNQLSDEKRDELIKTNPNYGIIICRCEEISKGEIIDCLTRPIPALTLDAIKRRVRAGMGRCQGGFCQEHIVEILKEIKNIKYEEIIKKGNGNILLGDIKEDLK